MRKWFFALALFAACSPVPKKETMVDPFCQPALETTTHYALDSPYFAWGDWPKEEWWEMYHSPILSSLIQEALCQNPDILAVKARVDLARAESIIKRAKVFPLVYFDGEEQLSYLSKNGLLHALNPARPRHTDNIDLHFSINFEVDLWWKYHNIFYAALGREQAQIAETAQIQLVISTALAQTYFALKTNLVRQQLFHQLAEVKQKYYDVQVLLLERALASGFEPALAAEKLEEAWKAVYEIDQEVRNNVHMVNILRGVGPDEELEVDEMPLEPPTTIQVPETVSIDLLARRPDVAAALWRAKAFDFEIRAAIADFYPNVNVRQLLGLNTLKWSKLFEAGSFYPSFEPAVHLPIFVFGLIKAGVAGRTAEYNEAVEQYNSLVLKSTQEVADTLVILDALYKKRDSQNIILENAQYRLDLAALNFEKGLDNILQVYQMEIEWIEKALVDVELIYGQYMMSVGLVRTLGGGYRS